MFAFYFSRSAEVVPPGLPGPAIGYDGRPPASWTCEVLPRHPMVLFVAPILVDGGRAAWPGFTGTMGDLRHVRPATFCGVVPDRRRRADT